MAMTKNKKKLRRAEKRYSVNKSAQTLVLAGLLLAGGVGNALAADNMSATGGVYDKHITLPNTVDGDRVASTGNQEFKAGVTISGSIDGKFNGIDNTLLDKTVTLSGGTSTLTAGAGISTGTLVISGGTVNAEGIMTVSNDAEARWRAGTMLSGDKEVRVTGGTVNVGQNAQLVVGYEGNDSGNHAAYKGMNITGGTVNLAGGLLRASSVAGDATSDTTKYATITIGNDSTDVTKTATVNTVAGSHSVIASRDTIITNNGTLNINGTTSMVGAMSETAHGGATPPNAPEAFKYADFTAGGKLTLKEGGKLNVANSGVLLAQGIDFVQDGGTFTTNKLTVGVQTSGREGDGAFFLSYSQSEGFTTADSLTAGPKGEVNITKDGVLTISTLDLKEGGIINIDGTGSDSYSNNTARINFTKDTTFAASQFGGTVDVANKINLIGNGRIWVQGALTLKDNDSTAGQTLTTNGAVKTYSLRVVGDDGTTPGDLTVTSTSSTDQHTGRIVITGDGNNNNQNVDVVTAGTMTATGYGNIEFGEAGLDSGGRINANVVAGAGTSTDATKQGTVEITGGTWTLASGKTLDVQANGTLSVGEIMRSEYVSDPANLDVSQGTLKVNSNAEKAEIRQLSSLKAKFGDFGSVSSDFTFTANTDLALAKFTNDGTLILTGSGLTSVSLDQFGKIYNGLMAADEKGTIKLDGVKVTTDENTKLSEVGAVHASIEDAVVIADNLPAGSSAVVGGLKGATSTITLTDANLTLTGQGTNGQLITGTAGNTGVELDNGSTLTFGNGTTASSGTLTGDVVMGDNTSGSTLNAVNGNFTVTGDIKGGSKDDSFNVVGANLHVNNISTGAGDDAVSVAGGSLTTNKLEFGAGNNTVAIVDGGSLNAGSIVGTGDTTITVGNSEGTGTLTAQSLKLAGGTLFADPSWINGSSSVVAVKDLGADGKTVDGKIIAGQNSHITLGLADNGAWMADNLRYGAVGGKLTEGGTTAAMGIYKPIVLGDAGSILVDGTQTDKDDASTAAAVKNAKFADNSLLAVNAAGMGKGVALTGKADQTLTLADSAKLMIVDGQVGQEVKIVADFGTVSKGTGTDIGWTSEGNLFTGSDMVLAEGTWASNGKDYTVKMSRGKLAQELFPLLDGELSGIVNKMYDGSLNDPDSPHAGIKFLSRATANRLGYTANATEAAATIEGAARLAVVGATQGVTMSAVTAGTSAATSRTSMASPLQSQKAQVVALNGETSTSGLNAGDVKNGVGLWIMPLYQSNNTWGMKAGEFKTGYTSDLGGVAIGADYTFAEAFRVGVAFNIGGGYAQSQGDFNKTDNNFNFWGVNLYGGWAQNNFGITADVGYTSSYNKLEQELQSSMDMGNIKADVTSSAITAGLRGEYKFETEALDIIPHVGVRYMSLMTNSYDAKSHGTVFSADESYQSIWTFPIGVTLTKEIVNASGWAFKPQLDLQIIPAAGDVKAKSKVRVPGIDASADLSTRVMDDITYGGGVGFDIRKDNVSFGVNYNLQASEHSTAHGVFATVRYEF